MSSARQHGPAGKARVLVVDDETNARDALVEILIDSGYQVAGAASAAEALMRIAEFKPDILLTDVRMEGMNGLELGRTVQLGAHPPRVAFMSAFPPPRPAPTPWLAKPIDLDDLFATVEELATKGTA
jgi:CheY-like chemotaxis protein